jgi:hypothetical protein
MGEMRKVYKISAGQHEGKTPLLRSRCRWKGNSKLDKERGCEDVDWIPLLR